MRNAKAHNILPCLGRIACPRCGRPDTGVMAGWRMWPHRYGEFLGDPQYARHRAACPGADPENIIREALALPVEMFPPVDLDAEVDRRPDPDVRSFWRNDALPRFWEENR